MAAIHPVVDEPQPPVGVDGGVIPRHDFAGLSSGRVVRWRDVPLGPRKIAIASLIASRACGLGRAEWPYSVP